MKIRLTPQLIACAVYFILHSASHLSAAIFEVAPGISIWYPPCGLALSLLLLLGPRYAPVVLVTNVLFAVLTASGRQWWGTALFPSLITLNYTIAAMLARRFGDPVLLPNTIRNTIVFVCTILLSPLPLALSGSGILLSFGVSTHEGLLRSVFQWWVGDVSGLLTVVPLVMVFAPAALTGGKSHRPCPAVDKIRPVETFSQVALLILALTSVFAIEPLRRYNAFYLCFLPLIWIALRHGLRGATIATLATTMAGLVGMHFMGSSNYLIANFLLFETAAAAVGLGLGAAVSQRAETQRQLAENRARFERVIEGAQLGLWDWDIARQHISYNKHWAEIIGCKFEQIDPRYDAWESLIHPADRERVSRALASHLFGSSSLYEIEYRLRSADRHWRWVLSRGSVVARDKFGQPLLVSGTHIDVTDRKHAEAETRKLLRINEATTDFILTTNVSGGIVYFNAAFQRLQSAAADSNLSGSALFDLMPAWAAQKLREETMSEALASGIWMGELALKSGAQNELPVSTVTLAHRDEENDSVSFSFIMRDISQQRKAEEDRMDQERRLLQVQKLESLGVLAGGVAHDFNNLLTVMLGNASLARFDLPANSPIQAPLGQIESAAVSAAELCQQMLAYAGRSPLAFQNVDIAQLIENTVPLIQVSLGKQHNLELHLARPIALIHADPSQVRQVVMNLAINASEAIGDRPGTIFIRASVRTLSEKELRDDFQQASLVPGRYLLLEVEDTGRGMSPEVSSRIFEPFYSTKSVGHGLGLAAVLGIMKSHGGGIHVSTTLGVGSCFRMFFPALEASAPRSPAKSAPGRGWKGSGLVLVVDDDKNVRQVLSHSLEGLGFTVLTACDGIEALDLYRQHGRRIRLVLLDLSMPRMDGEQTFHAMQDEDASIPIVLMSAVSEEWTLESFVASKPAAFIAKPFDQRALHACIEQLLP